MKALISLNRFVAGATPTQHLQNKTVIVKQAELLTVQLVDELFTSLHLVSDKKTHVHIYQRALQRLAKTPTAVAIFTLIVTALDHLKEQLPQYFNWNEEAICPSSLPKQFKSVVDAFTGTDNQLALGIMQALSNTLSNNTASWRHLKAINFLVTHPLQTLYAIDSLSFALEYDLDDTLVKKAIISHFSDRINNAVSPLEEIHLIIKNINQSIYDPSFGISLKQQLSSWLMEELSFLESMSPNLKTPTSLPKISTPLSVSHLAAFLKLIVEARIINCTNQQQLLTLIAAHIKTANVASVSVQSLRNKYYVPEKNTLSAMKDIRITLLNQARKMAGN